MSIDYLLHQHSVDTGSSYYSSRNFSTLTKRLKAFLKIRSTYGDSEPNAVQYQGTTLSAILNLAEFTNSNTQNSRRIKYLAKEAFDKIVSDALTMYSESGRYFGPTNRFVDTMYTDSTRAYPGFWILTGRGSVERSGRAGHGDLGVALASTSLSNELLEIANSDNNISTYSVFSRGISNSDVQSKISKIYRDENGHNPSTFERLLLQYTSGYYAHDASETLSLAGIFNSNTGFLSPVLNAFDFIDNMLGQWTFLGTKALISATFPSLITPNTRTKVYRNRDVVLSSFVEYYPNTFGGGQQTWVANVGGIPIWTQAGVSKFGDFGSKGDGVKLPFLDDPVTYPLTNTHLPMVRQSYNVALISYLPKFSIWQALGLLNGRNVVLSWPHREDVFDNPLHETVFARRCTGSGEHWLVGKKDDSYVAVLRDSSSDLNNPNNENERFYRNKERDHMWAVVVGNSETHSSFENFKSIISNAYCDEGGAGFRRHQFTVDVDGRRITNIHSDTYLTNN